MGLFWGRCQHTSARRSKRAILALDEAILQTAGVTPTAKEIAVRAASVFFNVNWAITIGCATWPPRGRDRPAFVTLPSEGLDDPSGNTLDTWLRLGIGDGLLYQLSGYICEFCNAAGEGIDRAQETS